MSRSRKAKNLKKTDIYSTLNDLKDTLTQAVGEKAGDAKEKATQMVNDLLENLHEKSDDYQESLEECITEKPFKSVAIALGLGFLLAKLL
jgi:ElaB/YqjD/DUF883 family membrane-anchored ribosome-binding protein